MNQHLPKPGKKLAVLKPAPHSVTTLELSGVRLQRGDHEFLPAALEILETPPSPIRIPLMLAICALVTVALLWSYIGRIDIIAVAQGKIQPVGRTKVVQPLETGKVELLNVSNGTHVRANDVLVTLDPAEARADESELSATLYSLKAEVARRRSALVAAQNTDATAAPQITFDADVPPAVGQLEQQVLDGDIAQLVGTVASLKAQLAEKVSEREGFDSAVKVEGQLIATLQDRVNMRSTLLSQDAGSKADLIDAQETLETQQTYLATLEEQFNAASADVGVTQRDIEKSYSDFVADNSQKLAAASREADDTGNKLAKARLLTDETIIRSPIDGVVQGLSITNAGQVITTGQEVMQIVPQGNGLEIQCYMPNDDIGFIRKGQEAVVKIASFPFTRYGTLSARVVQVAKDAIPQPEATQQEENPAASDQSVLFGGAERTQDLVFPVTLELSQTSMDVDGAPVPLVAGMAVTVEIKTGDRRILEYISAPLVQVLSQAMKER